jgi:PQQ enzyme repeat
MVEPKRWRQRIWRGLTVLMAAAVGGAAAADSGITYHGAADRSGLYVAPKLTWAEAATVRLDAGFHATVDGAVYSQPLYWVPPAGGGAARIIVATEQNFVYALDAGTGKQIWETSLGTPVPLSALPCGNIDPMGVTGTPTIDAATGIVYLEAFVQTSSGPRHMVFGLSLAAGNLAPGWPVDVAKGLAALNRGFNNAPQGQRSALTLVNGMLYVPYAGHYGDCGIYNGMVVGFNLATPAVFGAWSTETQGGGSWGQSGVAFDGTSMFVTTGNSFGSSTSWGGSEAVIRLPPKLTNPTQGADYFAPANWHTLDGEDKDLGGTSAIPVNVPVVARVLALGKDGNAYLLNSENLGGIGHAIAKTQVATNEIITAMATYPGADAARVAFQGEGAACPSGESGNLVMLRITPSAIATAWCASFNGSGAPIVTTTDGKANPIVWVVGAGAPPQPQGDGKLYGFRGTDGTLLAAVAGAAAGQIQGYQTILFANGRFYVAANGAVYAFAY